ncbi:hypothetical protein [Microbacterium sp. YY-01]|uniref:hypothetical protein n=1 Tax=Microbacterium sp. YY-01 TaxID=3421634 RepID=UPI003D1706B1
MGEEHAAERHPDAENPPARISLREELGGVPDPDFTVALPPGWEQRGVDEDEQARMVGAVRNRLMQANRPDIYARVRKMAGEAFDQMRKQSTVAMFVPREGSGALVLPASLMASIRHAEGSDNLDALVRSAIVNHGATPLFDDKRFLRMERDTMENVDGEHLGVTTVVYLTPIPGSERRRALQFTAVVMRPADAPVDDPPVVAMKTLFDLCVSSVSWMPA